MKKISLLALVLSVSTLVFSQSAQFGLKGGLNISTIHNNAIGADWNSRLGLNAGGLVHIHINPQWAVQPEVMFSGQGAKYTINQGEEHSLNLNYINIPVLLQYMFDNGFRLQTGPQLGFLIDVKDKVGSQQTNFFTSQDFKNTDVAWTVGLGYLTQSGFGVDGRYNIGLSNINKNGSTTLKNNVLQLGVFYMLDNTGKRRSR